MIPAKQDSDKQFVTTSLSSSTIQVSLLFAERTPISDEVLRRVGRNLVIFQQIEQSLKLLLANHKNAGPIGKYAENLQVRTACINKKMLGHLVEKYATEVLLDAGEDVPEEERPEDWFEFSFQISAEADRIAGLRSDLQVMINERNELVHHFLPRWQPSNEQALTDALAYLDAQRDRVLPMHEHLRASVKCLYESATKLVEFLDSPEFETHTEVFCLRASPLVTLFCEVADQYHRPDGWTYLAQAGALAKRDLPDEIAHLREHYGYKTLKQLLVGAGLFDVLDEPLIGGRFRTLYRRKVNA